MHHWCILDCVISPLLLQAMFHLLHHKGVAEEIGILHETVIHVTWLTLLWNRVFLVGFCVGSTSQFVLQSRYFIHYGKQTTTVPQSIWLVDFCRGLHLNFPISGSLNLPMWWDVFWPISGPLNWQVMNTTAWPTIRQKILAKRNSSWPVTFPCASFHAIPKLKHSCWAGSNCMVRGHPSGAWPPSPKQSSQKLWKKWRFLDF